MIKKSFMQESINGVKSGNGSITFLNIKLNVYVYFVDGILIDTGAQSIAKEYLSFFNQLKIDQVALTHYHEDHSGCASFLQQNYKVPILMNTMKIDACRKKADYPMYRKLFWGKRKPFEGTEIQSIFTSAHAKWDVIETPGHSDDHLSFLNRQTGQLFTGDLYCQERTKVVLREESIPTIIHSLKRVLTYDFDEVFCCHAGFLKKGRIALQRKLDYLLDIQERVIKEYKEGKPPEQINKILFPKNYSITKFSRGEWDSIHIINSIILDYDKSRV